MDSHELRSLRDITHYELLMWIWFAASIISIGILFGNMFATPSGGFSSGSDFNAGAMFGGFAIGLITSIPIWVGVAYLRRILLTKLEIHRLTTKPEGKDLI